MKDNFTLDGLIEVQPNVTREKVAEARDIVERAHKGSRLALATIQEVWSTSDFSFNYAHLQNLNVLPAFMEHERNWSDIANVRVVPDFRDPMLYTLNPEWDTGVLGDGEPAFVSPTVPEGSPYPYAVMEGETLQAGGLVKKGFRVKWTFEALINDAFGFIRSIPESQLQVALDTENADVFREGLLSAPTASQLAGGLVPTGATVPANAPFSRDALIRAMIELSERKVAGRKIGTKSVTLVVPTGQGIFVNFVLNQTLQSAQTGGTPDYTYAVNGYNPFAGVTVMESEYVTGDAWYVVPKGEINGRPVIELLKLAGHEVPELRVHNVTGQAIGGAAISPFQGGFAADTGEFRVRQFSRGVLWTPEAIIWSDGSGS